MIPPAVMESLSVTPTSQQMRDAAAELMFRISHGEFDDLDDTQRTDLEMLAAMLEMWARQVLELESAARPPAAEGPDERAKP